MSSGWCHWSLCSLLLLLGGNLAVLVEIHQASINGTVGQSVLLPVSYRFSSAPRFPLSIRWSFANSWEPFITCTLQNCSLGAEGESSNCSTLCFTHPGYRGHVELFPENGSLLLRDLQLSDSGVYCVSFIPPQQTWSVNLTVHEQRFSPEHPGAKPHKPEHIHYYATGICSSVFLLLLFLLFCYIRRRGAAQRQKRRIIKQQVSSVEESHMESTAVRDTATIYARIGDNFEDPQMRTTPEVVYTSITPLDPPGPEAGPYHLLI